MKISNRCLFFLLFSAIMMAGCQQSSEIAQEKSSVADSTSNPQEVSDDVINEAIESIPSPLEMSSIIHSIEPKFSAEFLHDPVNSNKYSTDYQKAVNIGIYATDLGFINIYNDKKDEIAYLDVIMKLAEDLKIAQFINYEGIKKLAKSGKNLDSLMYATTNDFDKINLYLQEQNKADISIMILAGGWIEAMYILSNTAEKDHNSVLYECVGEQKIVLDQLKMLLDSYKNNSTLDGLNKKLDGLKMVYDSVKSVTEYHKPTIQIVNGVEMVTDNSKTVTKITKEEVDKIFKTVSTIRKELIQ
jgi:hypothetical protein